MRIHVLLPMLALAACQPAALDPRGVDRDETLLTVTATGRADTTPDEARIQLGVQSLGPNAQEASRANREKMEQVGAALAKLGIKPADIQTRNLNLNRIDYGKDRGRFRADNVVEVRMRDAKRVGEAIAAATDAGANLLSGPDLRISNREEANRSAYAAAYRAARDRAEAYAGAAGLKIGRVLAIYDNGEYGPPVPYGRAGSYDSMAVEQAMAAPAAPPPPPAVMPFSPGTSTTEVRVRVDFALTH
ncbi:MAG: SIMPL domain-containing protein [Pseudomonadota bacterium]|nr:SIMPL domain-containing protein [Pseudomonadota bacterium]